MRNAFRKRKINEFCEVTSSKRIYASDYQLEGIPFYRGKEIGEKHYGNINVSTELFITRKKFDEIRSKFGAPKAGDLLLTSIGALLGLPYVVTQGEEFYFKDGNVTWFRNLQELDSRFLYYWMLSPQGKGELQKSKIGSAQPAFTINLLKQMEIELPPLLIQRRIAAILSAYDDLIENNMRRIKILEEMAQNLYREWFIKFRFPGYEHARFIDSPQGRIPEGWELIGVLENKNWSFIHQNIEPYEGKKRYFATADIDGITITGDGIEYLYDQKPSRAQKQPLLNSVWFARMQETYKVLAVAKPNAILTTNSMLSSGFAGLMASDEDSFAFLFLTIKSKEFHSEKDRFCTGATQRSLTNEGLSSILSISPPRVLVQQFGRFSMSFIEQILTLQLRNQTLRSTRDLLLPNLISGELDVSEMDIV
ncbi:MAG: restriction endonuclease subunit S [Anaerolineales bacterium]